MCLRDSRNLHLKKQKNRTEQPDQVIQYSEVLKWMHAMETVYKVHLGPWTFSSFVFDDFSSKDNVS